MERVQTLCNLLAEKIQKKATINDLLNTVKMIESELLHLKNITPPLALHDEFTSINIAKQLGTAAATTATIENNIPEEKTVELLQIDEAELEAELEEIRKNAEERVMLSHQNKPTLTFDAIEDVPTLAGRQASPTNQNIQIKELHESLPINNPISLNDALRKPQSELSESLQETPVKDIKKAIGINDRFKYLNELFNGEEVMYERCIKTINNFSIYPEAEYWIRKELKLKLGWDDKNETVKQFDQLVRRRFS